MGKLEAISIPELDAIVEAEERRQTTDEIDRIIVSYKPKLSADKLADFINIKYDKEFTPSQIRHRLKTLLQKLGRANSK